MPKVSVIIPAYNSGKHICEAIDSVLNQTFKDFELIVVDDGSTDDTKKKIIKYIDKIVYVYQENAGASAARNLGIVKSSGGYIAFLDSDDIWLPRKLEQSIEFLEKKGFDWMCTSRFSITEKGEKIERRVEPESGICDETGKVNRLEVCLFNLNFNLALTSTVLIKRKCFEVCGIFDEKLKICEDLDLFIRFKEYGLTCGYLDKLLTIKRSHATSLSRNSPLKSLEYTIEVAKKHAKILCLNKFLTGKLYGEFWWKIALAYYLNGSFWNATKYSLISFYYYPSATKLLKMSRYSLSLRKGG